MSELFGEIATDIRGLVNFLGIFGNIASFAIFSRETFSKNSINIYCRALAIFDCFTLNQLYSDINLIFLKIYPPHGSVGYCKFSFYCTVAFSSIPGWILVAFSLDKMLTMKKLPRFEFIKKRSFQIGLIIGIAIFHVLLYSEVLFLLNLGYNYYTNTTYCNSYAMPYANLVVSVYLIEGSLVPFVIMVVTSVFMVKLIRRSGRKSIGGGNLANVRKRRTRDVKFAITSLTFNFLFIILKLPLVLYYLLLSVNVDSGDYFFQIATLLFFVFSSISFLIHLASNSIFRREIVEIFRKMFPSFSNRIGLAKDNNSTLIVTQHQHQHQMPNVDI